MPSPNLAASAQIASLHRLTMHKKHPPNAQYVQVTTELRLVELADLAEKSSPKTEEDANRQRKELIRSHARYSVGSHLVTDVESYKRLGQLLPPRFYPQAFYQTLFTLQQFWKCLGKADVLVVSSAYRTMRDRVTKVAQTLANATKERDNDSMSLGSFLSKLPDRRHLWAYRLMTKSLRVPDSLTKDLCALGQNQNAHFFPGEEDGFPLPKAQFLGQKSAQKQHDPILRDLPVDLPQTVIDEKFSKDLRAGTPQDIGDLRWLLENLPHCRVVPQYSNTLSQHTRLLRLSDKKTSDQESRGNVLGNNGEASTPTPSQVATPKQNHLSGYSGSGQYTTPITQPRAFASQFHNPMSSNASLFGQTSSRDGGNVQGETGPGRLDAGQDDEESMFVEQYKPQPILDGGGQGGETPPFFDPALIDPQLVEKHVGCIGNGLSRNSQTPVLPTPQRQFCMPQQSMAPVAVMEQESAGLFQMAVPQAPMNQPSRQQSVKFIGQDDFQEMEANNGKQGQEMDVNVSQQPRPDNLEQSIRSLQQALPLEQPKPLQLVPSADAGRVLEDPVVQQDLPAKSERENLAPPVENPSRPVSGREQCQQRDASHDIWDQIMSQRQQVQVPQQQQRPPPADAGLSGQAANQAASPLPEANPVQPDQSPQNTFVPVSGILTAEMVAAIVRHEVDAAAQRLLAEIQRLSREEVAQEAGAVLSGDSGDVVNDGYGVSHNVLCEQSSDAVQDDDENTASVRADTKRRLASPSKDSSDDEASVRPHKKKTKKTERACSSQPRRLSRKLKKSAKSSKSKPSKKLPKKSPKKPQVHKKHKTHRDKHTKRQRRH